MGTVIGVNPPLEKARDGGIKVSELTESYGRLDDTAQSSADIGTSKQLMTHDQLALKALKQILTEMKIMNAHLEHITDQIIRVEYDNSGWQE